MIRVSVNGESHTVPEKTTMSELLDVLRINNRYCAVEQNQEVVPQEGEHAIRSVTETLVGEISRSLDFFTATAAESRINRVLFSGGGSRIPGLDLSFSARSGLEVEFMNPLARMLPSKDFDPGYLDSVGVSLGVGIGLATRKVGV